MGPLAAVGTAGAAAAASFGAGGSSGFGLFVGAVVPASRVVGAVAAAFEIVGENSEKVVVLRFKSAESGFYQKVKGELSSERFKRVKKLLTKCSERLKNGIDLSFRSTLTG